jgi:hypothetical protein
MSFPPPEPQDPPGPGTEADVEIPTPMAIFVGGVPHDIERADRLTDTILDARPGILFVFAGGE